MTSSSIGGSAFTMSSKRKFPFDMGKYVVKLIRNSANLIIQEMFRVHNSYKSIFDACVYACMNMLIYFIYSSYFFL